jgi:hypothetical protein
VGVTGGADELDDVDEQPASKASAAVARTVAAWPPRLLTTARYRLAYGV